MSAVLLKGSIGAVATYVIIGVFGYLIFVKYPGLLAGKNILHTMYPDFDENPAILLGNFALFFAVMSAAPLCVLPSKDVVEELFWKEKGMTPKINLFVTFGVISLCFLMAMFIPNIGDAITIAGCTTNPLVSLYLI